MSMMWGAVFTIACVEVVLFILLCIPLPASTRHTLLRFFLNIASPLKPAFVVSLLFLVGMLGESTMRYYDLLGRVAAAKDAAKAGNDFYLKMQLFLTERNMHLAFFTLFLLFVLWRFTQMIRELVDAEIMKKQAEGSSKTVGHLMEQLKEVDDIKKEKEALEKEREKAAKDLEAMKKQAESTQKEYMSLLDQLGGMQKKLEKFENAGESSGKKDK
eukprot:comp20591_c0_seq1/m.26525 comp20591_c0_seq1/g.26525  ORF comp20591_c0_seq1/g.26525 comp20591_c0_seq1/m.26525 type:complete len:215 (-) comp20591_c0_seq1:652-1296(-)